MVKRSLATAFEPERRESSKPPLPTDRHLPTGALEPSFQHFKPLLLTHVHAFLLEFRVFPRNLYKFDDIRSLEEVQTPSLALRRLKFLAQRSHGDRFEPEAPLKCPDHHLLLLSRLKIVYRLPLCIYCNLYT